jgi:hypothetical protein
MMVRSSSSNYLAVTMRTLYGNSSKSSSKEVEMVMSLVNMVLFVHPEVDPRQRKKQMRRLVLFAPLRITIEIVCQITIQNFRVERDTSFGSHLRSKWVCPNRGAAWTGQQSGGKATMGSNTFSVLECNRLSSRQISNFTIYQVAIDVWSKVMFHHRPVDLERQSLSTPGHSWPSTCSRRYGQHLHCGPSGNFGVDLRSIERLGECWWGIVAWSFLIAIKNIYHSSTRPTLPCDFLFDLFSYFSWSSLILYFIILL